MNALRRLAEREARQLDEFRGSQQAGLMIRLVHTECLLELARLSGADMDAATYAEMVVQILEQLLPVQHCSLWFELVGLPALAMARGKPCEGNGLVWAELDLGTDGKGAVGLAMQAPDLGPPEFVAAVAEQVTAGLLNVVEAERLRRQAAITDTARLTAALAGDPSLATLQKLVEAVAYLPNVLGVALELEHTLLEAPVAISVGLRAEDEWRTVSAAAGSVRTSVRWSDTSSDTDRSLLADVVDQLVKALDKAEDRRRLLAEARTDPLTGIANRRHAMEALETALAVARANDDSVAIAYFDLDRFKQVNDQFGHAAGDDVLIRFAAHLRSPVRRSDIVARIGGEEFLLVLPGVDELEAHRLLQRIAAGTSAACRSEMAPGWEQTTSVGLALYPDTATQQCDLLEAADTALYDVKRAGGDAIKYASTQIDGGGRAEGQIEGLGNRKWRLRLFR